VTMLLYQDQSATQLRLSLVHGPLDEASLTVLREQRIELPNGISLRAAIIGASHFVQLSAGNFSLYEVFACVPLHASEVVATRTTEGGLSAEFDLGDRTVHYEVRSDFHPYRSGLTRLCELEDRGMTYSGMGGIGLAQVFPSGPHAAAPKTVVTARRVGALLSIETAHAYPTEETVVFTESKIVLPEGGKR
jgi:hypothetical protein